MTKTEITNALSNLKKHGFKVYTFNSNKPMPIGLKGLPDHLVIGVNRVIFLEVKIGKDKLSQEQTIFKEMIERIEKRKVRI